MLIVAIFMDILDKYFINISLLSHINIKINYSAFASISSVSLTISAVSLCNTIISLFNSDKEKHGYKPLAITELVIGDKRIMKLQIYSVALAGVVLLSIILSFNRTSLVSTSICILCIIMLILLWIMITNDECVAFFMRRIIIYDLCHALDVYKKIKSSRVYKYTSENKAALMGENVNILIDNIDLCSKQGVELLMDSLSYALISFREADQMRKNVLFDFVYLFFNKTLINCYNNNSYTEKIKSIVQKVMNERDDAQSRIRIAIMFSVIKYVIYNPQQSNKLMAIIKSLYFQPLNNNSSYVCADILLCIELIASEIKIDNCMFFIQYLAQYNISYINVAECLKEEEDKYISIFEELKLIENKYIDIKLTI